jgi:hypothetical protein
MTSFDITGTNITEPKVQAISEIAGILRGEISATEAYRKVIEKLATNPEVRRLEKFLHDHEDAVEYWTHQLNDEGFEPETSSGIWGRAVEAFVATAQILGNTVAVSALREGEVYGLNLYKNMLNNMHVSPAQKSYIRAVLLPIQEAHVQRLEGFTLPSAH